MKTKTTIYLFITWIALLAMSPTLLAHCEIPCGIYGDQLRFELWHENITTVEKSMNQIVKLSGEATLNYNQIIRWISNKEKHADDIREIAIQYFLTQRVKPVDKNETELLGSNRQTNACDLQHLGKGGPSPPKIDNLVAYPGGKHPGDNNDGAYQDGYSGGNAGACHPERRKRSPAENQQWVERHVDQYDHDTDLHWSFRIARSTENSVTCIDQEEEDR